MHLSTPTFAQWSGRYGNEWISYESKYVKISVTEAGLYKLPLASLPGDFAKDPSTIQMWHRGREISLVHVDETEIWFYAELNDGASDSLFFRPASARMNTHQSFFSDRGVYFLTNAKNPKRALQVEKIPLSGPIEAYNLHTDVVTLREFFSFATVNNTPGILNNSFYENVNTWTGSVIYGDSAVGHTATNVISVNNFNLTNYQSGTGLSPVLNIMLNGLHYGKHEVQILAGKSSKSSDLRELAKVDFAGLGGIKKEGILLRDEDFSPGSGGVISLRSKTSDIYDWFSLSYYTLTYPQKVKMQAGKVSYFNFQASAAKTSRISIETTNDKSTVLDISDSENPKLLQGTQLGDILELMVPRTGKDNLKLLAVSTDQIKQVSPELISQVDFSPLFASSSLASGISGVVAPAAYDYLVISSDTLMKGAIEYAKYRSSVEGGGYNTIVYDVRNLYNQFNYGEPSAVAIKRFVEFMLKSGVRENHNLLLVGLGISAPDAAGLRLKKDLPHDVPTFGDPGSDVLLVSGLNGLGPDVPAIPVGRISAFNEQQVLGYLNKVKEFESDKSDKSWQKRALHLNGGKTSDEIKQLEAILSSLTPLVTNNDFGGEVKAFVKQTTAETERVDISKDVNDGVGMITYFGHGSPLVTDLDMGKASDVSRSYSNSGKYPLMYFNGCGVGNIYSGRSVLALSADWLLSPNVGSIAVIANSFNSYVSPTTKQLKILYEELFTSSASGTKLTIGKVARNVALRMLASSPNSYDIANIHQSNLQGDPAISLFNFTSPDYSFSIDKPLIIIGESAQKTIGSSTKLRNGLVIVNYGKQIKDRAIPVQIIYTYRNGLTDTRLEHFISGPSRDTIFFDMPVDSRNITRIEVDIDPLNTVIELNKTNNSAELNIDWDIANELEIYPVNVPKDIIAPALSVTINGRYLENEEVILPEPTINVRLADDNSLYLDPGLFDVHIRPCWADDCDYKKIEINSSGLKAVSDRVILLNVLLKDLEAGEYELLVNGKDRVGNYTSTSYSIRFAIDDLLHPKIKVVASPNPASEYIRFDAEANSVIESIKYTIYNASGKIVNNPQFDKVQFGGKQSWYWFRKENPAGLYIYRVDVLMNNSEITILKGKIILY